MRQQQSKSKEELLYRQVICGDVEFIRHLWSQAAGLEWIDEVGRTPLMVASMHPDLLNVAQLLLKLRANVNAHRPGSQASTALHHAAMEGLEQTVRLLLSHGANPFMRNDDRKTALELAREKGHVNVVRAIEGRISLFCGWMRESYLPGFLGAFSKFRTRKRKMWVVILPLYELLRDPSWPTKLELVIYPELQEASQPLAVAEFWTSSVEEPEFNCADPFMTIFDSGTKTRYKFLSENEGDKEQLRWFYNACCGVSQVAMMVPAARPANTQTPNLLLNSSSAASGSGLSARIKEDAQFAMAINVSTESVIASQQNVSANNVKPAGSTRNTNGRGIPRMNRSNQSLSKPNKCENNSSTVIPNKAPLIPAKHAPLVPSGACVVCLDAPLEGVCVPCGHMSSCMSCLKKIESKKWGCPICRAKITQVVRVYAVSS